VKLRGYHLCLAGLLLVVPAAAATVPNAVLIKIEVDGSFELNGVRYTDPNIFKAKLAEMAERKPAPQLSIVMTPATSTEALERAIILFQKAGIPKLGILVEPEDVPASR
jgi:biopolymer transport protein ExbD